MFGFMFLCETGMTASVSESFVEACLSQSGRLDAECPAEDSTTGTSTRAIQAVRAGRQGADRYRQCIGSRFRYAVHLRSPYAQTRRPHKEWHWITSSGLSLALSLCFTEA